MATFTVNILGCSSASQSERHQQSCQVVNFRDKLFMIDCGENAQAQFRRMHLKYNRLGHIFISHLHGDHFFGLPGLLSTMALQGEQGTVTIHTFEEGARLLDSWMRFFNRSASFEIVYDIITQGERRVLYEDQGITISTFPLYHRVPCAGFRFQEKPRLRHIDGEAVRFHGVPVWQLRLIKEGADFVKEDGTVIPNARLTLPADPSGSYAYCSDTMQDPSIAEDVRGVDTLFHEATYDHSMVAMAVERGHSTALQAAETARDAGVKRLVLGHFSKRYAQEGEEILLAEARSVFPDTILANEGMTIEIA